MTLFRTVTRSGTGAAAAQLNHPVGGKTGTTSDYTDAWFLGFSPSITCGVWVGYDNSQTLGEKETGARAALPIWMTVMRLAITGKDNEQFPGDEPNSTPPPQAAAAQPASVHPPTPVKTNAPAKPPSSPASAAQNAKPSTRPAVKPAGQLPRSPSAPGPQVKPALPPQSAPVRPQATVKSALRNP
jgi:penicillin-binding protein 1A